MDVLDSLSNKDAKLQMAFGFRMAIPMRDLNLEQAKTAMRKFEQALSLLEDDLVVEHLWSVAEDSVVNAEITNALTAKAEARQKLAASSAVASGLKQGV